MDFYILISTALINSYISHDELVSINNAIREYDDLKQEIKNLKTLKCIKYKESKNPKIVRRNKEKRMISSMWNSKNLRFIKEKEDFRKVLVDCLIKTE